MVLIIDEKELISKSLVSQDVTNLVKLFLPYQGLNITLFSFSKACIFKGIQAKTILISTLYSIVTLLIFNKHSVN